MKFQKCGMDVKLYAYFNYGLDEGKDQCPQYQAVAETPCEDGTYIVATGEGDTPGLALANLKDHLDSIYWTD